LLAPVSADEAKRLYVLRQTNLLDSEDTRFKSITKLGANLFNVPLCVVSLIDVDRQFNIGHYGTEDLQCHRNVAFCAYTILPSSSEVFVIEDLSEDERFKNNPNVTEPPHIKFYAGNCKQRRIKLLLLSINQVLR
jgi:hypothetical protein